MGKTTLAYRLGKRLGGPVIGLDKICYAGGKGGIGASYRPREERLAGVHRIEVMDTWIGEGVYLYWTGELFKAADIIIWLDLPLPVAAWRIITRHLRLSLRGRNPYPGLWRLLVFVLWTVRYYWYKGPPLPIPGYEDVSTRAATAQELASYKSKVIRLRHPSEVHRFLACVENYQPT